MAVTGEVQSFLLAFLLVFGLLMGALSFVVFMSWNVHLNVGTGATADVHFLEDATRSAEAAKRIYVVVLL